MMDKVFNDTLTAYGFIYIYIRMNCKIDYGGRMEIMRVYPKVYGQAAWSENCK
jgi:hypothetical protein